MPQIQVAFFKHRQSVWSDYVGHPEHNIVYHDLQPNSKICNNEEESVLSWDSRKASSSSIGSTMLS